LIITYCLKIFKENRKGNFKRMGKQEESKFYNVYDIMQKFELSKSQAYRCIRSMNLQLAEHGYLTFAGKIPKAYVDAIDPSQAVEKGYREKGREKNGYRN